jgi:hypothetical protein
MLMILGDVMLLDFVTSPHGSHPYIDYLLDMGKFDRVEALKWMIDNKRWPLRMSKYSDTWKWFDDKYYTEGYVLDDQSNLPNELMMQIPKYDETYQTVEGSLFVLVDMLLNCDVSVVPVGWKPRKRDRSFWSNLDNV